tara:strand:+ start:565 stop:987 length:423 start_codon:yes stop_codon:yes gene_type:complete
MTYITELNTLRFKKLRAAVNTVFGVDILDKCRKRNYVDARMVYSKILRDEKTSYQVIGQSLLKNHASIVYYIKSIDWILEHDKLLRRKYRHCINIIKDDGNRALTIELNKYSKQKLILWVKKLKNQNNLLSLELERLTID